MGKLAALAVMGLIGAVVTFGAAQEAGGSQAWVFFCFAVIFVAALGGLSAQALSGFGRQRAR